MSYGDTHTTLSLDFMSWLQNQSLAQLADGILFARLSLRGYCSYNTMHALRYILEAIGTALWVHIPFFKNMLDK